MEVLSLRYFQYQALEGQLCGKLSGVEFMCAILALIKRASLPNMLGSLVILDEYTVVPKPLLLLVLVLLKIHRIGTIICGDKNQLQNIHNSKHTRLSSYDLARRLADRTFTLDINERCSDKRYNGIIDYISTYSSDRRIDDFACAMVSAIFPRQLLGSSVYQDVHLASTHRELTNVVHNIVVKDKIDTSFYFIEVRPDKIQDPSRLLPNGLLMPRMLVDYTRDRKPDKFLPYIPLCKGAHYYLFSHNESMQGTLIDIENEDLIFQLACGDERIRVTKKLNNEVVFEPHCAEILSDDYGSIFNYPIYPTNIMSVHKCQGCTIHGKLDIHITNVTYQGLYVALSRVRDPRQVVRITMPNAVAHLCSAIINFPELCDDSSSLSVDATLLHDRLVNNYIVYQPIENIPRYAAIISDFFTDETSVERRKYLRRELANRLISERCPQRIIQPHAIPQQPNDTTLSKFLDHKDTLLSLACVRNDTDRVVWLHEYIRTKTDLLPLILMEDTRHYGPRGEYATSVGVGNVLASVTGMNNCYPMSCSTREYLRSRATQELRIVREGEERERQTRRTIYYDGDDDYIAMVLGSEFQAEIYKHLETTNDTPIESSWLETKLHELLRLADEHVVALKNIQPKFVGKRAKLEEVASSALASPNKIDERFAPRTTNRRIGRVARKIKK